MLSRRYSLQLILHSAGLRVPYSDNLALQKALMIFDQF